MHQFEAYKKRPIKFLEQADLEGWSIKIYGITTDLRELSAKNVMECKNTLMPQFPQPPETDQRYGIGFLVIHQAKLEDWFSLNWWENENIIHQQLFVSPSNEPRKISPVTDKSVMACVYELEIYSFERQAWVETVFTGAKTQNFEKYLQERLNA